MSKQEQKTSRGVGRGGQHNNSTGGKDSQQHGQQQQHSGISAYASPNVFCPRCRGMGQSFVRCYHLGSRFVVQVQGYLHHMLEHGCVDYVEDTADGGIKRYTVGYFDAPEEAEKLWQDGIKMLLAGEPVPEN